MLLLLPLLTLISPMAHADEGGVVATPQMSMAFAWAPRWGSYDGVDDTLVEYGFEAIGPAMIQGFGLRGRAFSDIGLFGELSMTFGVRSATTALGSTTTYIETGGGIGYRHRSGFTGAFIAGFSNLTQAVASETGGGALNYQGPSIEPKLGWTVYPQPGFGPTWGVFVGYNAMFPVGLPHQNRLWEATFERDVIHSFSVGIESGIGLGRGGK